MAKKKKQARTPRVKDNAKRAKRKVCVFCKEHAEWVDYKDANLLRRFMSERAKIRARRVTGNCAQHQREVATAIKTARELALLPYASRVTTSRGGGRGGRRRDDDRGREPRESREQSEDREGGAAERVGAGAGGES